MRTDQVHKAYASFLLLRHLPGIPVTSKYRKLKELIHAGIFRMNSLSRNLNKMPYDCPSAGISASETSETIQVTK